MAKNDTPSKALNKIMSEAMGIVKNEAFILQGNLIETSPIDTGHFKASWQPLQQIGRYTWRISNTAEYATILAVGRHAPYGSLQWSNGLAPMLQKTSINIESRVKKVKE